MAIGMKWFARIVDGDGAPVVGLSVDIEFFDLDKAAWTSAQTLASGTDGKLTGNASLGEDALPYAPAARLVETGGTAVLSSTPQITRAGKPPGLRFDFGEITHVPAETRVTPVAAAPRARRASGFTIAGVPSPVARGVFPGNVVAEKVREVPAIDFPGRVTVAQPDVTVLKASVIEEVGKTFAARLSDNARIIAEKDNLLTARQADIADRDSRIATATARAEALASENERLKAVVGNTGEGTVRPLQVAPVPIANFATSIGTDLHSAQATLASRAFSIGRIEVNARGLLGNDGTLQLQDQGSTVDSAKLSDVKLEFRPDAGSGATLGVTVPDVAQLTETAARRVLASVGLQMQASYGPPSLAPDSVAGQTMLQTPRAGETAPRGARVLVVFASDGKGS